MSYPGNDDSRTNESDQPPAPSVTDWIPSQPTGEATSAPSPPFTPGTDQPTAGGRPFVAAADSYQPPPPSAAPASPPPPSPAPFAASQSDPTTGQNPPVPVAHPVPVAQPAPTTGSIPMPQYAAGPPTMGQPPVGQPYAPVPSPPTYDPAAVAQPYSVQPYSVQPYSVAPASGAYAYGIPSAIPAPEKRRRTGVVVLSILTTLFLLAAGVMTTLFVLTKQERDRLDGQVQRLGVETTDQRQKINTLQGDLDNTKRDLTDSQSETKEVADQKAKVSACVKSFLDLLAALNRSNGQSNAEVQRLDRAFSATCNEAEKYLD
jgi:hypothetical protein